MRYAENLLVTVPAGHERGSEIRGKFRPHHAPRASNDDRNSQERRTMRMVYWQQIEML
jgi:hypothetical protein